MIQRLTVIAEFRDDETGAHISRMGYYARILAERLSLPSNFAEQLEFAAPMHDIGKIGIPDSVLFKPGKLTAEEFDTIKKHTVIGHEMLKDSPYETMKMAASISLTHHEKWDGSGYPGCLRGENIPIEGRIVIICDQYDALRMKRPYKPPLDHETAFDIITRGDDRTIPEHFDPEVLNVFKKSANTFNEVYESLKGEASRTFQLR